MIRTQHRPVRDLAVAFVVLVLLSIAFVLAHRAGLGVTMPDRSSTADPVAAFAQWRAS